MSLSNDIYNSFFEDNKDGIMIEVGAAGPNYLSQSLFFKEIVDMITIFKKMVTFYIPQVKLIIFIN